jgi:hypothetical protein
VVPTFRPYAAENLEFGGFYASSCESRVNLPRRCWAGTAGNDPNRTLRVPRTPAHGVDPVCLKGLRVPIDPHAGSYRRASREGQSFGIAVERP